MSVPMSDLEPTGERLIPDRQPGELVLAEHLARYRLAAQLAPGRRVLDAACGEGYGLALMAAAGPESATGVDVDPATVEHVRERHGLDARQADVRELPFADDAFDLVVSFETIEHVPEPERALDELARVLAPGGLLLISTPNASQYLVANEFHVREFGHDEFAGLLRERFGSVRLLYQHNWLTSAVLEEGDLGESGGARELDLRLTKVRAVEPGDELYLLALCGDGDRDVDVGLEAVGVVAGTDEAHELARQLVEAQGTAAQWHERYQETLATAQWMRSTLTWRLTKPFRALTRLARRGR
jgi:SAM-dependent methyltransferase